MHTCLNADKIVRLIACELVASGAKGTAVALARCRKNHEDPVLDVLWETQEKLLPLFKSLPGDVWEEDRYILFGESFKRLPTTLEWARFRKYARRMRKLGDHNALCPLPSEVFSVLQLHAINEPLFPNLKTLDLRLSRESIPFVPLFLSHETTTIRITSFGNLHQTTVASMITSFSTLCPNLQEVSFYPLPRDPMVIAAVSKILLASSRTLRCFSVDSPLTEEARQVVCRLPNLRDLWMVIEKDTQLPLVTLPNLTDLTIKYDHDSDWLRVFYGATFGKLAAVTFYCESEQIGGFLEAFRRVTLERSARNTLSTFRLYTSCSWNPNYFSLLQFTQLTILVIQSSCRGGCSSTVDDDVVTNLAQAMPRLRTLELGDPPCREIRTGVTVKGLVALVNHCPNLCNLRVHFHVASLHIPLEASGMASGTVPTVLWRGCALTNLKVGEIPIPEETMSTVALTLSIIFPNIKEIDCVDDNWEEIVDAICITREIIDSQRTTL